MGSGLTGGPLTGGPLTAVAVIAPTGQSAIIVSPLGAGASDVVVKAGSSVAAAGLNDGAKLLSIRTGLTTGSETEYVYFKKAGGAFTAVQVIDTKSQTHVAALAILNQGAGDTGIWFEGAPASGGAGIGLGSVGTRGLFTSTTNRTQSWYINNNAFSTLCRAIYDWEATDSIAMRTMDLTRYTVDAAHTGNLASWYVGSNEKATVNAAGAFTGSAFAAPAATSATLQGPLGAGGTDVVTIIGTTVSDGGTHASAKLLSVGTGIGGTYTDKFNIDKNGNVRTGGSVAGFGLFYGAGDGNQYLQVDAVNGVKGYLSGFSFSLTGSGFTAITGGAGIALFNGAAQLNQSGTDSSGSPGAATINKPTGISAIANGATTCTITNSLVPAVATKRIRIIVSWNGDHGAARSWAVQTVGGGSFVVTLSAAASANTIFSWELSELL